jgi:hypothetical protein
LGGFFYCQPFHQVQLDGAAAAERSLLGGGTEAARPGICGRELEQPGPAGGLGDGPAGSARPLARHHAHCLQLSPYCAVHQIQKAVLGLPTPDPLVIGMDPA